MYIHMLVYYIAKDVDTMQTMRATTTANRVCVNLGAADEEDSDDVMENTDNG